MVQELPLPDLPAGRYRLDFQTVDEVRLPEYAGSAWRGVFGRSLKRLVCVTREPVCERCLLYRSCIYPYIFETPPDPAVGKMTRQSAAPHPYVLRPQPGRRGRLPPGEALSLELILFGHGNRLLAYLVHALDQAGQRGIGAGNGRLRLTGVAQEDKPDDWQAILVPGEPLQPRTTATPVIPPCPERCTLLLETPLRIKQQGRYVTPETFRFGMLFSNLLRRISLLTAFHTDTPLETDFAGLSRAARELEPQAARLRWRDWTRFSARQGTEMQMGGLLGEVVMEGRNLAPFWPYLWLGQWTHAGKGTSMGLGRYRIVAAGAGKVVASDPLAGAESV